MNPMLISVCREYIELYQLIASGSLDRDAMQDADSRKSTLRAGLMSLCADRDLESATHDTYNYALAVIALADSK